MGYLQFGRHGVRQIIRFKDAVNDSVVVNPLLYASQGLRYNRKLQVILTTVSISIYLSVLNCPATVTVVVASRHLILWRISVKCGRCHFNHSRVVVLTTLKTIIIHLRVLISGCGNGCSRVAIYEIVENGVANAITIVVTLQFGNIENHYVAV